MLITRAFRFLLVSGLILFSVSQNSVAEVFYDDHIEAELISEVEQIGSGQRIWLAVRLLPEQHWHTYWQNPGDSGLATTIQWQLPEGVSVSGIHWPYPQRIDLSGIINYGFEGETFLLSELLLPDNLPNGEKLEFKAAVSWLVCETICIPGNAHLSLTLPIVNNGTEIEYSKWKTAFDQARAKWPAVATDFSADYAIENESIVVRIRNVQDIVKKNDVFTLFPINIELIDHSATQIIVRGENEWLVRQKLSPYFKQAPEVLNAVFLIEKPSGVQAWQIAARQSLSVSDGFVPVVETEAASLWFILLLALSGGVILNLMPCVFPILSLKAMSLLQLHGKDRREQILHGVIYTVGVVSSFVLIAGILIVLRAGGESIGWGFQLQSPWFVASLVYLLFLMGLSLSGFFQIGLSFMGSGQSFAKNDSHIGTFFTGVLATLVASPCTAPFMGTAMGFAMLQSTLQSLLIFAVLGLGMALPFLLLAVLPHVANYLPRPGRWMETFKQLMAYPLYVTAIWLLWVLGNQTNIDTIAYLLIGLLLLVLAIWCWGLAKQSAHRLLMRVLAVLLIAFSLALIPILSSQTKTDSIAESLQSKAEPFSMVRLQALRQAGQPVFVNLTADWCITCKVNEKLVLNQEKINTAMQENNITYLVGDWTNRNAELAEFLQQFGRTGVPLYLVYPAGGGEPEILPQILTPSILLESFKQ